MGWGSAAGISAGISHFTTGSIALKPQIWAVLLGVLGPPDPHSLEKIYLLLVTHREIKLLALQINFKDTTDSDSEKANQSHPDPNREEEQGDMKEGSAKGKDEG